VQQQNHYAAIVFVSDSPVQEGGQEKGASAKNKRRCLGTAAKLSADQHYS
jgi:hypothetical protein